jgi:hypothetical protein
LPDIHAVIQAPQSGKGDIVGLALGSRLQDALKVRAMLIDLLDPVPDRAFGQGQGTVADWFA